jgi:hypothetical protein
MRTIYDLKEKFNKVINIINPSTTISFLTKVLILCIAEWAAFNEWCWEKWIATCSIRKLGPYPPPHIKMDSKWVKN